MGSASALEIHYRKAETHGSSDIFLAGLIEFELYRGLRSSTNFRLEPTIRGGTGGGGLAVVTGMMGGGVLVSGLAIAKVV